jgi:hypothetical protein
VSTEKIIVVLSLCGFLFIFDAVLLGFIFFTRRKVTQASKWPSTMGSVILSTIQRRRNSEGRSTSYPIVHYTYQGDKIMPGPDVGGSGAHKVVARYPIGAQVMVYYNPGKPSEALLERGMPGHMIWFWIILGILNLVLSVLGAVLMFVL